MRLILILLIALLPTYCFSQELITVRDTVNDFEIGIPVGWQYGVPQNKSVDLVAIRQKSNDSDVPRENFNVFVLEKEQTDLNVTYKAFLESISTAKKFKVLKEGERIINNRHYKWLIETHKNQHGDEAMHNYIYLTSDNGKLLILTMVTISENFPKYEVLFEKVASSLKFRIAQ